MTPAFRAHLRATLDDIDSAGLRKHERVLATPQRPRLRTADGRAVLNFCANNYLGLADHPDLIAAAHAALDRWGYGLSSVRFICGTQEIHRELESRLSTFLQTDDTILYSSCFDANAGIFETLLTADDAVISDELNHASIIDGIRLSKARRYRYRNADVADLAAQLDRAARDGARFKLIATDGVFSMDGSIAPLRAICDLADQHDALVMVDDSHAVGFIGRTGRGTPELCDVLGRVDILSGTLGKALGGASGGYVSGRREIIALLRQRSRPYLFSNTLAPVIAATSIAALDLVARSTELRDRLATNTRYYREKLRSARFDIPDGSHPIVPIMLGDARVAQTFANRMLDRGIYVVAFSYPVVPQGTARIRTQVSAAHSRDDLDFAIDTFAAVRAELDL
jgi:2-amino-3-ketobutyrate coenzyme A ligase